MDLNIPLSVIVLESMWMKSIQNENGSFGISVTPLWLRLQFCVRLNHRITWVHKFQKRVAYWMGNMKETNRDICSARSLLCKSFFLYKKSTRKTSVLLVESLQFEPIALIVAVSLWGLLRTKDVSRNLEYLHIFVYDVLWSTSHNLLTELFRKKVWGDD